MEKDPHMTNKAQASELSFGVSNQFIITLISLYNSWLLLWLDCRGRASSFTLAFSDS